MPLSHNLPVLHISDDSRDSGAAGVDDEVETHRSVEAFFCQQTLITLLNSQMMIYPIISILFFIFKKAM